MEWGEDYDNSSSGFHSLVSGWWLGSHRSYRCEVKNKLAGTGERLVKGCKLAVRRQIFEC